MSLLSRFKRAIGPGVITGIADDDPSGIVTYAQTGAIFGLSQLWMTLYTIPLMIAVQEMCARVGMVTGMGIAGVIKKYYSKKLLFCAVFLLTIANTINIGADIGAMGEVVHLVSPLSSGVALIIITIFTIVVIVVTPYHLYAKILKYFAASVLAYVVAAFFITQDWSKVALSTIIPHIEWNKNFLFNMTAFLGTTISPYLFFWQADEEVEEAIDTKKIEGFGKGRPEVTSSNVKQMRLDTFTGMILSNLIAFFIIITASSTLPQGSLITSASQLAESLRPLAGDFAVYLFAFGIIGTGLLAIPVLSGSIAYAIAETFSLPIGLSKTLKQAIVFYGVISVSILVGVLLNFININPIVMLYYAAAVNGVLAAPLLVIILFIANNKKILGVHVNSRVSNVLVVFTIIIMALISIFAIESLFK